MMVMTTKVDIKKILIVLAAVVAVILAVVLLFGGSGDTPTDAKTISNNDARVQFLKNFGWEVTTSPKESSQVRIPEESTEVFDRYNELQKSMGYDLSSYKGKAVMRYVYKINNYPGATEPVYATLLIYKNQVIGGDITDTSAKGKIRSFKMPQGVTPEPTLPSESAPPTDSTIPT